MKLFFLLLRSSWAAGLTSGVLGAVSGMASLGLITLIHRALTEQQQNSSTLPLLFAGSCLMVLVTQVTANWMLVRLSQSTAARLRFELCSKITSSPLSTLEAIGPHRLNGTLISDVNSITGALTGFPGACANAMVLVFGLLYLAKLSLPLAVATIVMAAVGVSTFLTGLHIANRHLKRARTVQDEVMRHLYSMIYGIKELKGNKHRTLDFMYDVLLPADSKMRHKLIHGLTIQGFAHSWGRLILFIGIGLLLFLWPRLATVTTATLTGYTLTILYLTYPLDGILGWLPALNGASIAVSKIEELGLLIEQSDSQPRLTTMPPFHSLELRNVVYQYDTPDDKGFSLGPVSFKVSAGEVLYIAGSNGSGKTTLAKLLTGLYVPDGGNMYWNGRSVTKRSRADYRQLFSTVFVEGHLFDRLLGIEVDQAEVTRWLTLLGIEEKLDRESGRFLTKELSRGQHKRLALLVACLDNRPLFVFDEWAAEQDPVFKDVFYRQIVPELSRSGKTVIAITHDDRYFSAGDRMLTLIDGEIMETSERRAA